MSTQTATHGPTAGTIGRFGLRVALQLAVAVAVALGLSWLAPRSPVAAGVVTALGVVALGVAVMRAVRARRPVVALAVLGGYVVLGAGLAALVSLAADGGAALAVDAAPLADTAGDCAGCGAGDLVALAVSARDGTTRVRIDVDGAPDGQTYRIWDATHPAAPITLAHDTGWRLSASGARDLDPSQVLATSADGTLWVQVPAALTGVAVTTGDGDRLPDVGGAGQDLPSGRVARAVASALADVQAGWGRMDDAQRLLAATLVRRQLAPTTATYRLASDANPDLDLQVRVAAEAGRVAQQVWILAEDGGRRLAQTTLVLDDEVLACDHRPDGADCTAVDDLDLPVGVAAAMARAPAAIAVAETPPRDGPAGVQRCVTVSTTTDDGPATGELCATQDGLLGYRDNDRTGQRLVLIDTAELDPSLFAVPEA